MKRLVEFPLEDGNTVLIEAKDSNYKEEITRASQMSPQEIVKTSNKTFEESIDIIKPVADVLLNKLKNLCDKPE